jgi:hypothetical protein
MGVPRAFNFVKAASTLLSEVSLQLSEDITEVDIYALPFKDRKQEKPPTV